MINQTPTPVSGTLLEHTANATSDFWLSCGIICVRRVDFDDVDKCINAWIREQIFVRALSRFIMFRVIWLKTATRVWIERRGGVASCGESFSFIRKRQAGSSGASRPIHRGWISKVRDAQNLIDRALGALFVRTNLLWFICFVSYCVFWGGNIIFLTRIVMNGSSLSKCHFFFNNSAAWIFVFAIYILIFIVLLFPRWNKISMNSKLCFKITY